MSFRSPCKEGVATCDINYTLSIGVRYSLGRARVCSRSAEWRSMRRRDFIVFVGGGLVAGDLAARAQSPALPVIGFLNIGSASSFAPFMTAFHQGLNATGYTEDQNVAIEYRWAEGDFGRVREFAAELVRRQVNLLAATGGTGVARVAKAATDTIPILFVSGFDPVQFGLVASLGRPGGNATGLSLNTTELVSKRLELLHELTPKAAKIALLVNPTGEVSKIETKELEDGVARSGLGSVVLHASAADHFESVFATAAREGAGGLLVSADPFFTSRRDLITRLAAEHKIPACYPWREYAAAGGLMSYGPSITDAYQQIGRYAGRILKGAKPADLPVQVPTRFELAINVSTAHALGLSVSPWMLARADEVIQ